MDKALIDTIKLWLQQEYDTEKHDLPTWHTLVKAISMIDHSLASEIAAEHPKGKISCTVDIQGPIIATLADQSN